MKHFSITQAAVTSAVTFVVGQLVAFVPSLSNDQEILISLGSSLVAVAFLVANAIHAHASVTAAPVASAPVVAPVPVAAPAPAAAPAAAVAPAPPASA